MAVTVDGGRRASVGSSRTVLYAVLVLTGVSLGGAAISVRTEPNPTYLDAVGPNGYLSVPRPMMIFQLVTALAAGSDERAVAMLGSGLLGVAAVLAVVSGFFDGGYTDQRLNGAQRAHQMTLVTNLGVVAILAMVRVHQVRHSRTKHRGL